MREEAEETGHEINNDFADIRAANQRDVDRLVEFNETSEAVAQDIQATITTIHPDGATSLPVASKSELIDSVLAAYSDEHGDFGLYGLPHEGSTPEQTALTEEQAWETRDAQYREAVGRLAYYDRVAENLDRQQLDETLRELTAFELEYGDGADEYFNECYFEACDRLDVDFPEQVEPER